MKTRECLVLPRISFTLDNIALEEGKVGKRGMKLVTSLNPCFLQCSGICGAFSAEKYAVLSHFHSHTAIFLASLISPTKSRKGSRPAFLIIVVNNELL